MCSEDDNTLYGVLWAFGVNNLFQSSKNTQMVSLIPSFQKRKPQTYGS